MAKKQKKHRPTKSIKSGKKTTKRINDNISVLKNINIK
jgi:hypothetical protein